MFRLALMSVAALALGACTTAPPPAPPPAERLSFAGTLDLSRPGISFHLTHESGLACDASYGSGRLPDTVTVLLACNDAQTGTLTVVKAGTLSGTVTLSGGRTGDVLFQPPPAPRVAAVAPPPPPTTAVIARPPAPRATTTTVMRPPVIRSATNYVRPHTRRGTYVRGHYRKGKWVSGHHRRGTTVRGHYRRR